MERSDGDIRSVDTILNRSTDHELALDFGVVMFQTSYALALARKLYNFHHGDLWAPNVMLQLNDNPVTDFQWNKITYTIPDRGFDIKNH